MRIAAILTSHNRCSKTISALARLRELDLPDGARLDIFLTDDRSPDGTAEAVKEAFPEVHLFQGDGSLFWGGGMRLAFTEAMKSRFDFYLWVNDDTLLFKYAILRLVETYESVRTERSDAIVIGSTCDPISGKFSYGGSALGSRLRPLKYNPICPSDVPQPCDIGNGNCVFVPGAIAKVLANINPMYTHKMGDLDYMLRARKEGFALWVAPGWMGSCTNTSTAEGWLNPEVPLRERWRRVTEQKGLPPNEWRHFVKAHGGPLWFIYFASPYCRTVLADWNRSIARVWHLISD